MHACPCVHPPASLCTLVFNPFTFKIITDLYDPVGDFPATQMVKNMPVRKETRVRSLGWEVSLEEGKAVHSSILAWRIPWTEKPGRLQFMGSQRVRHNCVTNTT